MIINFISSSKSVFPYRSYSTSPNNQHYRHHYNLSSTSQVSGTDVSVFIKIITISLLPVISADVSVQVPPFVTAACWNCREIRKYYFSNSPLRHLFQYSFCNMILQLGNEVWQGHIVFLYLEIIPGDLDNYIFVIFFEIGIVH